MAGAFDDLIPGLQEAQQPAAPAKKNRFADLVPERKNRFADLVPAKPAADGGISPTRSAAHSVLQYTFGGVADAVKGVVVASGDSQRLGMIVEGMGNIDAGKIKEIRPEYQTTPEAKVLASYLKADPGQRAQMRAAAVANAKDDDPTFNPIFTGAQRAKEGAAEFLPESEEMLRAKGLKGFVGRTLPRGAGSMLSFMLPGLGTQSALRAVGPTAQAAANVVMPAGMGAMQNGVQEFEAALEKGASLSDAYAAFNVNAIIGTSEAVPIARWFDRLDKATGGKVRNIFVKALAQGTEESVQELGQAVLQNLVAAKILKYDPEREIFQGAGEGFATGGVLGAVMGLAAGVVSHGRARRANDQFGQIHDAMQEVGKNGAEDEAVLSNAGLLVPSKVSKEIAVQPEYQKTVQEELVLGTDSAEAARLARNAAITGGAERGLWDPADVGMRFSAEEAVEGVMTADADVMANSATYTTLRKQGLDDRTARIELAKQVLEDVRVAASVDDKRVVDSASELKKAYPQLAGYGDTAALAVRKALGLAKTPAARAAEAPITEEAQTVEAEEVTLDPPDPDTEGLEAAVVTPEAATTAKVQTPATERELQLEAAVKEEPNEDARAVLQGMLKEERAKTDNLARAASLRESAERTNDPEIRERLSAHAAKIEKAASPEPKTVSTAGIKVTEPKVPAPIELSSAEEPAGEPAPAVAAKPPSEVTKEAIDAAAHEAATSPKNELPEPSKAQIDANNYKLGHARVHGLDISIENPQGSERRGTGAGGKPWARKLTHHYGYIKGSVGRDKDHVDAFVGPNPEADTVYVVDQLKEGGKSFDEHKTLIGFNSEPEAREAYLSNYPADWNGLGAITAMPVEKFKTWVKSNATKKPLAYKEPAKPKVPPTAAEFTKQVKEKKAQRALKKVVVPISRIVEPATDIVDRAVAAARKDGLPLNHRESAARKLIEDEILERNLDLDESTKLLEAVRKNLGTETPAAPVETPTPAKAIVDVGEKIGGARKDWRDRGLTAADLQGMTGGEEAEAVKKTNIWKPDYEQMIAGGADPKAAALVKLIYDRLAAQPKKDTREERRNYLAMMEHVRDAYAGVKTVDDVKNARTDLIYNRLRWTEGSQGSNELAKRNAEGLPNLWAHMKEARAKLFSVYRGRNEPFRVSDWFEGQRAGRMIAEGWPKKKERQATDDKPAGPSEPTRPHLDRVKRTGKDLRGGKDVGAEDFRETFGFRGVEFGNWAAQDERQKLINLAYDALRDLASVLGIPEKAISLNGTLGLALGARGNRFAAHYESGKMVINMAKITGSGALAHEWGHALDHYFGEVGKQAAYQGMATGVSGWHSRADYSGKAQMRMVKDADGKWINKAVLRLDNLRPEVRDAWNGVMQALFTAHLPQAERVRRAELSLENMEALLAKAKQEKRNDAIEAYQHNVTVAREHLEAMRGGGLEGSRPVESSFYREAQKLSGKSGTAGYWARPTEMLARSFEAYVFDKVKARGDVSQYLVHGVEGERFADGFKGNPYPKGEERAAINAAYDKLFQVVKSRETDKGLQLYSENERAGESLLATSAAEEVAAAITANMPNAPKVLVYERPEQLPESIRAGTTDKTEGLYHDGTVYLFTHAIRDRNRAAWVVLHEIVGHHGLRGALGADFTKALLEAGKNEHVARLAKKIWHDRRGRIDYPTAIEEALSELAAAMGTEEGVKALEQRYRLEVSPSFRDGVSGALARFYEALEQILRKLLKQDGPAFSNADVRALLDASSVFLRGENKGTGLAPALAQGRASAVEVALRRMARAVDQYLNGEVRPLDTISLGDTPQVLRAVGAPDLPLDTTGSVFDKVFKGKHATEGFTAEILKELPTHLHDPLMVFDSAGTDAFVVVTELPTASGLPVLVAMDIKRPSGRAMVNRVTTIYGRKYMGTFVDWAKAGKLRYIRNDESLGAPTTVQRFFAGDVVQAARGSGAKYKTASDLKQKPGLLSQAPSQPPWDAGVPDRLDDLVYTLQDKHVDTKRVLQAIEQATARTVQDENDPYLQEELFHKRAAAATEQFLKDEMTPLLKEMQREGVTIEQLEEYLHNRHAEERNAQIASINQQMPDGGSGIDTADARSYLAALPANRMQILDTLAARVDAITNATRQLLVGYGLESPGTVQAWGSKYQRYVPLFREDADHGQPGSGQGFSVRGPSSKRAMGSRRKVVDILANVAMQRERAITRGEKNRVAAALVGLAKENPNPDFWKVDQPPMTQRIDGRTGMVVVSTDPLYKLDENVVVARIPDQNGEVVEHAVIFEPSDERALRMAQSLKNLDLDDMSQLLGLSAKVTRYFASINTQYNPVFGVVNLVRDVQSALLNLSSTPIAGKQRDVLVDALRWVGAIFKGRGTFRHLEPADQALWEEFEKEGGSTGYRDLFRSSKDRSQAIQRELDKIGEGKAKQALRAVFDWLSDYNTAMENAVRLSAYKAAKEQGLTKQRAASLAKNLTVNFNRKGQTSSQAGALYAFFNASVQGTARMGQTLTGPAGKKIIAGGLLLGVLQALALAAAGFDDEEPPQFVRERNLILPIGDKKYLTLPMPLGFHVIPNLTRVATEYALGGFRRGGEKAAGVISTLFDAFSPVGGSPSPAQFLAPTAVDPLVALSENMDWTGRQIYQEDFSKLDRSPGHTRAKDTATVFSKFVSELINKASGGTEFKPGMFSPTPDQLDYLISQVTGGLGREASKVVQTGESLITGEELPTHKIPLLGRFYGSTDGQSSQASTFYRNLTEINEHENEIKGRRKAKQDVTDYVKENPEARLMTLANHAETNVRKLRKKKRELIKRGAPRADVQAIDEKITAQMANLNRRVEEVRAGE